MRLMIAVVVFMVASVLSIVMLPPTGRGAPSTAAHLQASVNSPAAP
jgi:hypothetical protein